MNEIIYSVANEPNNYSFLVWWVAVFGIILGIIYFVYKIDDLNLKILGIFLAVFMLAFNFLGGFGDLITLNNLRVYKDLLSTGNYSVTEGVVKDFDPAPFIGHKKESFSVNGIVFKYSDYEITGAFNKTKSHGGPIYEGRWVKLYYKNGRIIQIESRK